MTLQGNPLLKVGVPVLILAMAMIVIKGCSDGGSSGQQQTGEAQEDATRTLTQEEMEALGISGDSSKDTVATLVGKMNAWERQRERDQERMEALVEENQRLAERASNVDNAVNEAIREERRRQQEAREQSEQSLLARFEQRMDRLLPESQVDSGNDQASSNEELPIGLGLEGGGGPSGSYTGGSNLAWVEPMDQRQSEGRSGSRNDGPAFPASFKAAASEVGGFASRTASAAEAKVTGQPDASTVEPVYTIPENSTLMGSLGMTALLGRVPVDGTVNDPYPFKVMIGNDNLTANGIVLPEVQAAVASGTATGDWTLSCVRGNITSMTFVFQDGTIRTVPTPEDANQGGGQSNSSNQDQT
ncbi:TIGR03752 family integrating conjugative element protein, partial [Halomonas sp. BBD48]|nr:TIGR03752 family integrating conjugative element protein [Halomonas sp. BBD48]